MEKLIELINEHQKEIHPDGIYLPVVAYRDGIFFSDGDCLSWVMDEIHLISKPYGFIKRLVDNDKIDLDKVGYVDSGDWHYYEEYENVLMRLATDDEPIRYLLSIIKD